MAQLMIVTWYIYDTIAIWKTIPDQERELAWKMVTLLYTSKLLHTCSSTKGASNKNKNKELLSLGLFLAWSFDLLTLWSYNANWPFDLLVSWPLTVQCSNAFAVFDYWYLMTCTGLLYFGCMHGFNFFMHIVGSWDVRFSIVYLLVQMLSDMC